MRSQSQSLAWPSPHCTPLRLSHVKVSPVKRMGLRAASESVVCPLRSSLRSSSLVDLKSPGKAVRDVPRAPSSFFAL